MLSASSSLISMNCPDLALSTSLRGKGSAAGDSMSPAVGVGGRSTVFARCGWVGVVAVVLVDWSCAGVVVGVAAWPPAESDTEVRRCGGGREPRAAGKG